MNLYTLYIRYQKKLQQRKNGMNRNKQSIYGTALISVK